MQRFHQFLFVVSVVAFSWLAMMAVHELGHVVGAVFTGGSVERVILHPLAISRTDVSPNPHRAIVVWLGPIVGCVLPLLIHLVSSRGFSIAGKLAQFFAGFCLIANGAYISIGSFGRIGDCGEMLRTGTPLWTMITFGAVTIPLGLYLWHVLGSLNHFIKDPSIVTPRMAYLAFVALALLVTVEIVLSSQ